VKLAGCFTAKKNSVFVKDQGKFDFSCHDLFMLAIPFSVAAKLLLL